MEKKKRSPIMVIGFAVLIGFLVIALLNGTIRPSSVVAAKVGLAPGTLLTADLFEVRSVPAGGVPSDAFKTIAEVEGQMLTVGRAPGDFITKAVVGESAASGIPSQLEPGHVALAVHVNSASGVAGLVREGQTITIIGMLAPDVLQNAGLNSALSLMPDAGQQSADPNALAATPTPVVSSTPAPLQSPLVRIAISGVKVLLVPQSFRYQELPPGSGNDQMFASATTSQSAQSGSVIVLDVCQLYPGAKRPLRWNFLQIPKRVDASRYRTMICELFANAGRMGPRQLGFMRRALTEVYTSAGVLFNGLESFLTKEEADALGTQAGLSVHHLTPEQQQALAVLRSKQVSIVDWMFVLRKYYAALGKGDQASRTSLEGVLLRLEQFEEGQMLQQYGPGADSLAIEDLGLLGSSDNAWGIAVIEGGAEMDEFVKAALFSLLATVLYYDAVVRRRESLNGRQFPVMDIFFEEANKVLSGVSSGAASDTDNNSGGSSVAAIWESMWRDGRKYGVFLHLLAQTVSKIPQGIFSSCANLFAFQTKDAKDRDMTKCRTWASPRRAW